MSRHNSSLLIVTIVQACLAVFVWTLSGSGCIAQELDRAGMLAELQRLEAICRAHDLGTEAAITAAWLPAERSDQQPYYLPTEPMPEASSTGQAGALHDNWAKHFNAARVRYAQWLFSQAAELAAAGDEAEAFRLLWQVLREDASHPDANRILGTLATAARVKPRLRKGTIPHADFGWPAGSYSRIETPHFMLTTRSDPRESIELAQSMETFYALWRQVFYPLWAPPGTLTRRFAGRNLPWEKSREMQVTLLRDRDDYLQVLGVAEKNAAISVGYYEPRLQKSFFYIGDGWQATLFHELTHQLFAEATNIGADPDAGGLSGVWLTEGIANYMESLTERDSYWTLGGYAAPRLQTARYRAIRDGYWDDWQGFTQAGRERWKQDPQIGLLYAQATGLSHLFMDQLEQPAARQAFFQALVSVYQDSADFAPLLALLGKGNEAAKLAYQNALTLTDSQVIQVCQSGLPCPSLVLAGSELKPDTWSQLAALAPDLEWLDVAFSNATSADLQWLDQANKLQRLSVEGTHCDARLLARLRQLPVLIELDLTGCHIDDEGLNALRGHPTLETLWLEGTLATPAAKEILNTLPSLDACHSESIGWAKTP